MKIEHLSGEKENLKKFYFDLIKLLEKVVNEEKKKKKIIEKEDIESDNFTINHQDLGELVDFRKERIERIEKNLDLFTKKIDKLELRINDLEEKMDDAWG